MRSLMKKIDLFCYKHPRFGVNNLMLFIVIGNALVWLLTMMDTTGLVSSGLTFSAAQILRGQIWRLVTFVFVSGYGSVGDFLWLALFLYFYYWIGSTLEREWGAGRFTIYYLIGVVLTIIFGFATYFVTGWDVGLSAGYINLSMFFAFATLFPDMQVLLFFFIPIKVKWLAIVDAFYFVYQIVLMLGGGWGMMSFLPLVAVLNYFVFCGDWIFSKLAPKTRAQRKNTVDFKREVSKLRYEERTKPYTRKCCVCGRTDADHPELEFRYCSRCAGYHCFCQDHINSHVHFTE